MLKVRIVPPATSKRNILIFLAHGRSKKEAPAFTRAIEIKGSDGCSDGFHVERRASRDALASALRSWRRASLSLALAFLLCSRCRLANVVGLWLLEIAVLPVFEANGHSSRFIGPRTAGLHRKRPAQGKATLPQFPRDQPEPVGRVQRDIGREGRRRLPRASLATRATLSKSRRAERVPHPPK